MMAPSVPFLGRKLMCAAWVRMMLIWHLSHATRDLPGLPSEYYEIKGDILLAGVLPVHKFHITDFCDAHVREFGALQRLEAMAFAVNEINKNPRILPNVTLGIKIIDDCSKDTTALAQSLHFIEEDHTTIPANCTSPEPQLASIDVVGIIGSESSKNTVQMAGLMSLYNIPMVSYISTSPLLSDKDRYPYFLRIVPSDTNMAKTMVAIIQKFSWVYVSVIYAEGSYGTEGYKALKSELEGVGYCLAAVIEVKQSFTDVDYDQVILQLIEQPRAKAVVIFTPLHAAREILTAAKRNGQTGKYTWIGSDAWGRNLQDHKGIEDVALGAINIRVMSRTVHRFDEHFKTVTLANTSNPWLKPFWEEHFQCNTDGTSTYLKTCTNTETLNETGQYVPENTVSLVIDAVNMFARSLHSMRSAVCPTAIGASAKACLIPEQLIYYLNNVSFPGELDTIKVDNSGDGFMSYQIQNLQFVDNEFRLEQVGIWNTSNMQLILNSSAIMFNANIVDIELGYPKSTCSDLCPPGFQHVLRQPKCCWDCEKCRDNERTVIVDEIPKCQICPVANNFTWPDDYTRTQCEQIPTTFLSLADSSAIIILCLAIISMMLAFLVTAVFVKNRHERLIKACSQELAYMSLIGIMLSSVFVYALVLKPSDELCILTTMGFHLCFTFSYGPLIVKTNRVFRIFDSGKKSNKRPSWISSKAQIVFASGIVVAQVRISLSLRPHVFSRTYLVVCLF